MTMKRASQIFVFCFLLCLGGCGTGGPGPTGPHGNPDALSFSYCRVVDISGEMHVQWSANRATTGDFCYGLITMTDSLSDTARADSHDVVLVALQHSTRYIFQLTIEDSVGHRAMQSGQFTTPAKTTPEPEINGVEITDITESSASVSWRTDVAANTILYYGQASLNDSVMDDSLVFVHQMSLTGLSSLVTYRIKPESADSANLRGFGPDTSFTTAAQMTLWSPDTSVALGDTMRLPIYVSGVQDLAALHFGMVFQPGALELIDVKEGPFYLQNDGFIFFSNIRNSSGQADADMTWNILYQNGARIGTDADGGGIVAYVILRGLTNGDAQFTFSSDSSFALDMFAVMHSCSLRAGTVQVGP